MEILKNHPELEKFAKFTVDEDGVISYQFIQDCWIKFDVPFKDYFFLKNHPDDAYAEVIDSFYEELYAHVVQSIPEGYRMTCADDRYFVEKIPEPPAVTIEEAKAAKLAAINAQCDVILDTAVSSYPQSEVLTFDQQVSEVEKYQTSGNPASAPLLSALADARGISLDELCLRVMTKRAQFSVLSGIIIGQRQRLEDILDTLTTVAEVQALDVQIRMPTDPPDPEGNPTDPEAA